MSCLLLAARRGGGLEPVAHAVRAEGRRYLSEESMAAIDLDPEEAITTNTAALPAA